MNEFGSAYHRRPQRVLPALREAVFAQRAEQAFRLVSLVAEEVEKVAPELVKRDREGKPYTVRYDAVNAMLLNEFLKEHKVFVEEQHKVEKLETTVVGRLATVKEQATQIQKVSAQLEVNRSAPQTALNNQ